MNHEMHEKKKMMMQDKETASMARSMHPKSEAGMPMRQGKTMSGPDAMPPAVRVKMGKRGHRG